MPLLLRLAAVAAGTVCAACHGLNAHADTPAVRASATPEANAEIESVLHAALGDRRITLSSDALTQSSVLTLQGSTRRDVQGQNPLGRDLGQPEQFQLLLSNGRCFLVRRTTGERWPLTQRCVPESE